VIRLFSLYHRPMKVTAWPQMNDDLLMEQKISSLGLTIGPETEFYPYIQQLYQELENHGLSFKPPCFLADEWFCPVGIPAIGIPFYLAHPRLRKIEKKEILEVEGGTHTWFMKLLRHEAGHAYSYAYRLYRRKIWREMFGSASLPYPDTYKPKPHSHSYVVHLDNWYAQSHPDEDFAETFATWLAPSSKWKKKYSQWKAIKKLNYVDKIMAEIAGKKPLIEPRYKVVDVCGLNLKMKTFYARKKKECADSYPDFYDKDLKRLFDLPEGNKKSPKAHAYLSKRRKLIRDAVAIWTREKKYTIDTLLTDLITRCRELDLRVKSQTDGLELLIGSFIASMIITYLFTGKFKRSQ
jgi:hypothetical protein